MHFRSAMQLQMFVTSPHVPHPRYGPDVAQVDVRVRLGQRVEELQALAVAAVLVVVDLDGEIEKRSWQRSWRTGA